MSGKKDWLCEADNYLDEREDTYLRPLKKCRELNMPIQTLLG